MNKKNTSWYGLLGVLGIWVTDGFGFPLVNYFSQFSVPVLLVSRGVMTMLLPFFLRPMPLRRPSWRTISSSFWLGMVAFTIFTAFRAWGVSLTMTVFSATVLANFFFAYLGNRRISAKPLIASCIIIAGVTVVLKPWGSDTFQFAGLIWSLLGVLSGALFYEEMKKSDDPPSIKLLWQGLALAGVGAVTGALPDLSTIVPNVNLLILLLGFGFFVGFLNLYSNVKAIEYLEPEIVSAFVPGGTVLAIIVSGFLLGEHLDFLQWAGVVIVLGSAWYVQRWLNRPANILD